MDTNTTNLDLRVTLYTLYTENCRTSSWKFYLIGSSLYVSNIIPIGMFIDTNTTNLNGRVICWNRIPHAIQTICNTLPNYALCASLLVAVVLITVAGLNALDYG